MRKLGILFVALALSAPAFAADKLGFGVERSLASSLQNERQAAARYEAFMAKAEQEGYPGAANLFRACAKAERIHARRFKAALEKYGAAVPAESPSTPSVGETNDNLRTALAAEQSERDSTYRDATEAAKAGRNADIARLFDVTRDTETEHANLLAAASHSLAKLKQPKAYWICTDCGFTADVRLPLCPSCRVSHELVEVEP